MNSGVPSRDGGAARPAIAALGGTERQLWDAHDRAVRGATPKIVLVLHLSRLPAPRVHHLRVARVLLHDTAQRYAGQVFDLANHDLVLLCAPEATEEMARLHSPSALAGNLARLFAADMPDRDRLLSMWDLASDGERLHAYLLRKGAQAGRPDPAPVMARQSLSIDALQQIVARAPLAALMRRQTGLSLSPDRGQTLAARLAPAFQSLTLGLDALRAPDLVGGALGDSYLAQHFAAWTDSRIIALCLKELGTKELGRKELGLQNPANGGSLLRPAIAQSLPVLIEISLRSVVGAEFGALARRAEAAGLHLWVGVKLLAAAADFDLLDHARRVLALTRCRLAIVFADPLTIGLVDTAQFGADFAIAPWSAHLREAWPAQTRRRPRAGQRSPRLIMTDVDCEQAIAWGQASGVDLFAGSFPDRVQAATRMQHCGGASACTLAQCLGRAGAAGPGRAGCTHPALLDEMSEPASRMAACA